MWGVGVLCAAALLIVSLTHWVIKSKNARYKNGVLPPGSMGLPFIGETLQLLIPGRSLDVHPFLRKRIERNVMSFPVNIPGTALHDLLKKKDLIANVIRKKLHEKLNSPEAYQGDLLDQLINDMKTETFITEEFVVLFVLGAIFVSSETIAVTLTLGFKLLSEHPSIVDELKAEHDEILRKRNPCAPLTWSDYQSMTFTLQVINEVLRLANPLPGNLRKATKDIQVNGYIIPQGWTIMIASSAQHLNPNIYKDPLAFNPHRWKELDPSVVSKNFMPFGVGGRQCSGAEYSKVFMSVFFHILCTKYRWTKVKGGDNVSRNPYLDFGDKIHINVHE